MATKTVEFVGVVKKGRNKVFSPALKYSAKYDEYLAYEDIPEKELPSNDEVLTWRNQANKQAARSAAITTLLDAMGVQKPNLKNDPQLRLKNVVKNIMADGVTTLEEAKALASNLLKIEWADEKPEVFEVESDEETAETV
jgi:hypothetical protein